MENRESREDSVAVQAEPPATPATSRSKAALGLAGSVVVNFALPFLIYQAVTHYTNVSQLLALVLAGLPSTIEGIAGLLRRKRIDPLAGLTLAGITLSLILIALGASPTVYLMRESFFTAALGLACLVSLLFPRPLMFYAGRHFATGNRRELIPWFDSLWQYPAFRAVQRNLSLGWGLGFLLEAGIRVILVLTLSAAEVLLFSSLILYGVTGALLAWTLLYTQWARKRGEAFQRQMSAR